MDFLSGFQRAKLVCMRKHSYEVASKLIQRARMVDHLRVHILVDPTGIEPVTSALQMQCSSQLSYRPKFLDLYLAVPFLCIFIRRKQPSHIYIVNRKVNTKPFVVYI